METVQPYPFKGFWIRAVASIIDGILLLILIVLFAAISLNILGALWEGEGVARYLLVFILAFLAMILYKPIMEASDYQGTFGKYALGMKVIDRNGQKISIGSSFVRTILWIIGQTLLLCIGAILAGFTEYKQGLHDMLAKTYVVTSHWDGPVPLEDNFGA